jgi:hypothetical protein
MALVAAIVLASSTVPVRAQMAEATPVPVAPRLIAPHAIAFATNAADGIPAGMTRAAWLAARGSWSSSTEDGLLQTRAQFSGLVAGGHYSLFTQHTANKTLVIEPIDRSGMTNSFVASPAGEATATVTLSQPIVKGDQILLVYHSDMADHPKTIGKLGTEAHIQLRLVQP